MKSKYKTKDDEIIRKSKNRRAIEELDKIRWGLVKMEQDVRLAIEYIMREK